MNEHHGAGAPAPGELGLVVDPKGRITECDEAFWRFLGSDGPGRLVGQTMDDLTVGRSRRTILRAAADALAIGVEVGPLDCWFAHDHEPAAVGRFWLQPLDEDRLHVRGVDLRTLDPETQSTAIELLLLERAAAGDPHGTVLAGIAQLVEWGLPGAHASVGVLEEGTMRHRFAPSLPGALLDHLEAWSASDDDIDARAPGLVCHQLGPTEAGPDLSQLVVLPVDAADGTALGLLAVYVPEAWRPDRRTVRVLRVAADAASSVLARSRRERDVRWSSLHDALTGLANRDLVIDQLSLALTVSKRRVHATAVLMIDLDDFKVVNDALGHAAGDEILRVTAAALDAAAGPDESVGRIAADEFLVVTSVADADHALRRAEELRALLDHVMPVGNVHVRTRASIGVAVAGGDDDAAALVRDAGAALHRAKDDGRNRVALFDASMRRAMLDRVAIEAELRQALARREVEVHYQPIVDLESMVVAGVESLVRWRREGADELIAPDLFVPTAEDAGLIADIGAEVLRQSVETMAALETRGLHELTVSVNVSPHQLTDAFVPLVDRLLRAATLDPSALVLEITERTLLLDGAADIIVALTDLGVAVAIDDFGTGYSGLNHLRSYPTAESVKIDGSFVADIEGPTASGQTIVAAAVALAHGLGMQVVAEGVETQAQLEFLRELGCDRVQGFLLAPPLAADELESGLRALGAGARTV